MEQNTNNQNNNQSNQPMDPNNRKVVTIAGVILVVVVLGALLASGRLGGSKPANEEVVKEETTVPEGCDPGNLFSTVTGEPCPDAKAVGKGDNEGALSTSLGGYDEMLKEYTGRIVLLDASGKECVPTLSTQSYPKGTRILLANHSMVALGVKFQDKSVRLSPYHYATSLLNTEGQFNISCNGDDVATITVTAPEAAN